MKLSTLCYIEKENNTLMLHRTKKENDVHKDRWIGLGGKVENGESPEECVLREVKEESGLILTNLKLRATMTFPKFKDDEDWYVYLYTSTDFTGELQECDEGMLKWVDSDKLLDLNISEGDKLFLGWLKIYKLFSAKFIYREGKLIEHSLVVYE